MGSGPPAVEEGNESGPPPVSGLLGAMPGLARQKEDSMDGREFRPFLERSGLLREWAIEAISA